MPNPLQSLIPKDPETGPDPNGMRGKMEMMEKARQALKGGAEAAAPVSGAHATPFTGTVSKPLPAPNPKTQYGTRPGEKRIDVGPMVKPLGQMHAGGTVPKTGAYVMREGEKVLTPEQHGNLKNAMSLAQSALSHDQEEPQEPVKTIRAMHIRKAADGSHVIEHHHVDFSHPMEEHTAKDTDELHDHIEQHWGEPNKGEGETPGQAEIQKAIGMEK